MPEIVNPGWEFFEKLTFSPAVMAEGRVLAISGMTATNDEGELQALGDMAGQARQIYHKMGRILSAAGADFSDVIATRDFIITREGYKETAAVRREVFGSTFPAATGVIVAGLIRPGALIEIEALAVVPE